MLEKPKNKNFSNKVQAALFTIFSILLYTHAQLNPISINIDIDKQTKLLFVEPEEMLNITMNKRDITDLTSSEDVIESVTPSAFHAINLKN